MGIPRAQMSSTRPKQETMRLLTRGFTAPVLAASGLSLGSAFQVVAGDEKGGHRSADEGAYDVAHGAGGHAHLSGVFLGHPA